MALPLLFSRRIVETSMTRLPWHETGGRGGKSVLKQAVRDWVPEAIIAWPKSGMMVPVRFWFQGDMRCCWKEIAILLAVSGAAVCSTRTTWNAY
ncbi:MAG: asparagine synthase-related protein [Candidatus Competibacteraceae bacterium]